MVKYSLVVCSIFLLFGGLKAQPNDAGTRGESTLYYYFGAQKINLVKSKTHIYVEASTQAQINTLQIGLQGLRLLGEPQIQPLAVSTRRLITIEKSANVEDVLLWLNQQAGVAVAGPMS